MLVQTKDLPPGLDMRVSQGQGRARPRSITRKLAPAKKLADAEAEALLSRAQPIKADAADKQAFALRPKSQPPPRTGNDDQGRVPAAGVDAAAAGEADRRPARICAVLRYMPEGDGAARARADA